MFSSKGGRFDESGGKGKGGRKNARENSRTTGEGKKKAKGKSRGAKTATALSREKSVGDTETGAPFIGKASGRQTTAQEERRMKLGKNSKKRKRGERLSSWGS